MNACYDDNEICFSNVSDQWLGSVRPKLKPTTCAAYETILARHIKPELRDYSLAEIDDSAIAQFWEKKKGEGLSFSTLNGISCVLRAVVRYGGKYGCGVTAEACKIPLARKRTNISVLSDAERSTIVSAVSESTGGRGLGVLVCLYTGLRVGEICGLKWGDISPDNHSLSVRRTVSRMRHTETDGKRTSIYIGMPKTNDSSRRIPLPTVLAEALEKAREPDDCYVLSGSPHKVVEPRSMQRYFNNLLKQVGIDHVNYHALRHSFATQCVDLGFDVKALSMILGHADVGTTLNTYVHPSFERMRSMMELLT